MQDEELKRWRERRFEAQHLNTAIGPKFLGECQVCKETKQVSMQGCRTAYADDKQNTRPTLCDDCAADYHSYWDDMWAEYYHNVM